MQHADDIFRLVFPHRRAGILRLQNFIDDFGWFFIDVDRFHLGAVDHDVGHLQIAQIKHAAKHVGVALGEGAFLGLQIDRAADLFVRRQNIGRIVSAARRHAQQLPDDEFDRLGRGCQQRNHDAHDRRDSERDAV